MEDRAEIERALRDLLCVRSPRARSLSELPAGLALGSGGLGLDSIALAELLLDCEQRFALPRTTELLAGPPLTWGRLVAHVRARRGS